jgi:hypothetical protein
VPFTRARAPLTTDLPSLTDERRGIRSRDVRIALGPGDLPSPETPWAMTIPGMR